LEERALSDFTSNLKIGKGKVHPRTGHEGLEEEWRYSSTLSLTSALDGVGGQHHAPAALPPGMTRYPLYRRGWAPGTVWTGAENLAPTGIRSPDRPARSESLYLLWYPGPYLKIEALYFSRTLVPTCETRWCCNIEFRNNS
jgi:hypothetical protein